MLINKRLTRLFHKLDCTVLPARAILVTEADYTSYGAMRI